MRAYDVRKSDNNQQLIITQNWPVGVKFERTIDIANIPFVDGYGLIAVDADHLHNNKKPTYIVGVVDQDCNVVLAPENGVLNAILLRNGNVIISAIDLSGGIFDTKELHYSLSDDCLKMHDLQKDKDGNTRRCVWTPCPNNFGVVLQRPHSSDVIGYYDAVLTDVLPANLGYIVNEQSDDSIGSYVLKQ